MRKPYADSVSISLSRSICFASACLNVESDSSADIYCSADVNSDCDSNFFGRERLRKLR